MSVNSEIYNAYNLYIIENIHAIVPRGNLYIYIYAALLIHETSELEQSS